MGFSRKTVSALAALGLAVPLAMVFTAANANEATQVPTRTIKLDELPTGTEPMTPWLADGTIQGPDAQVPVDSGLELTNIAPVGPAQFVALDDTTGDGMNNRLVRIDEAGVTELAEGPVTRPFVVSDDGDRIAWSEWSGEQGRLVLAEADSGEVVRQTPIDAETYTVGFSKGTVVVEQPSGGAAKVWTPGQGLTDITETKGATATDPQRGLIGRAHV